MSPSITADATDLLGLPPGFSLPRSMAIAAAISLHLTLAAILAMPIAAPESEPQAPRPVAVVFETPKPPPPIAPPPPVERTVTRLAPVPPQPAPPPPLPVPVPSVEPLAGRTVDTPSPLDLPAAPTDAGLGDIDSGPAVESLQLRRGTPPRYPPAALSRRLEGEVELLILVGVDGAPESVSVSRSSGHAVLDRAAREHVLRRWVFVPSQRNGIAVPTYVRVTVRFTLP